jgi:hypothetical protein
MLKTSITKILYYISYDDMKEHLQYPVALELTLKYCLRIGVDSLDEIIGDGVTLDRKEEPRPAQQIIGGGGPHEAIRHVQKKKKVR